MPIGSVMPSPKFYGWYENGAPLVGGFLYTFRAGTVTPEDTFTDSGLTVPNSNPIVLDAGGRATVFLAETTYKFVLRDPLGNLIWSQDNIASVTLGQSVGIGEEIFSFGGTMLSPITDVAYPAGATIDKLIADSGVWAIDPADLVGTFVLEMMLKSGDGVITVTGALVNLSDGAPDTAVVTVTSTSATGERKRSANIGFPAGGSTKLFGIKAKVSGAAPGGFTWQGRIVRVA